MIRCVKATNSLAEAIDAVQADDDRGVVVVDSQDHVVGILTEGDIIRAIRRGMIMEALVHQAMTVHPQIVVTPLTAEELALEFSARGTLIVPVVDADRRLVSVQRARAAVAAVLKGLDTH